MSDVRHTAGTHPGSPGTHRRGGGRLHAARARAAGRRGGAGRARRHRDLGVASAFDAAAAARYGTLVTLTIAAGRQPRPRRIDLMIAAVASAHGLPLYTRNVADFRGLGSAVEVIGL